MTSIMDLGAWYVGSSRPLCLQLSIAGPKVASFPFLWNLRIHSLMSKGENCKLFLMRQMQ